MDVACVFPVLFCLSEHLPSSSLPPLSDHGRKLLRSVIILFPCLSLSFPVTPMVLDCSCCNHSFSPTLTPLMPISQVLKQHHFTEEWRLRGRRLYPEEGEIQKLSLVIKSSQTSEVKSSSPSEKQQSLFVVTSNPLSIVVKAIFVSYYFIPLHKKALTINKKALGYLLYACLFYYLI